MLVLIHPRIGRTACVDNILLDPAIILIGWSHQGENGFRSVQNARAAVARATCMEVYIECWSDGSAVHYPWSIWLDGEQLVSSHAHAKYRSSDAARTDALQICSKLGREPDRITEV